MTTTTVILVAHICITEYYVNGLSCLKVAAVSDSFAVFDICAAVFDICAA